VLQIFKFGGILKNDSSSFDESGDSGLRRSLGVIPGTAIVIGSVIGTGVFLKSAGMAQLVGSSSWVLAAWILAGLLSLAGALAYSELGVRFPHAGGEYVYLSQGFGPGSAFLYGWTRFWIVSPASIAAYAVGSATFVAGIWLPSDAVTRAAVALVLIAIFTALNCYSVVFSGWSQTFITLIKIATVLALTVGVLFFGDTARLPELTQGGSASTGWPGWSALGTATLAALWAYDGWNNLPMMAGEMKNPNRSVPISLGLGMAAILILYTAINYSFFWALPFGDVLNANSSDFPDALPVATKAAMTFLGPMSVKIVALAFVISAVGAMNGQILAGARVPYAMAKSGLFFGALAKVSPRSHVPVVSVVIQSLIACLYALSGTFDQLTDSVVFASWIFYGATTVAVFKFRKQFPAKLAFQTPGYPWVPAVFVFLAVLLVANAIFTAPLQSLLGLGLIGLGLPAYAVFRRRLAAPR
jgi:basic amino acid/polyamine antiporter, APA family